MKNRFWTSNFPIKNDNWNLKKIYHFSIFNFEVKIEMPKNVLFYFNFKLEIDWHFRCTDWKLFNFSIFKFKMKLKLTKTVCPISTSQWRLNGTFGARIIFVFVFVFVFFFFLFLLSKIFCILLTPRDPEVP